MRIFALTLTGVLAVLSSKETLGQERSPGADESPATARLEAPGIIVEPPAPTATNDSRAAALYRDAESNYLAGNISEALRQMQLAYDLSGRPELLFNLGQLQQELRQCRPALLSYRQYLLQAKQGKRREKAELASQELERDCPDPVPSAPTKAVVLPLSTAPGYWTTARAIGWSSIGAAVAAGAGATYLALRAGADERSLETRLRAIQPTGAFTEADKARETAGKRSATWARVLGAGTLGLTTVGVTLLVLGPPKKETRTSALSITYAADTVGAVYSRSFE